MLWTIKCYFIRISIDEGRFVSTLDIALDCTIAQGVVFSLVLLGYIAYGHELDTYTFVMASVAGLLYTFGDLSETLAFQTGPGGPINALVSTEIIY